MSETNAGKTFAIFDNSFNQKLIASIANSNNQMLLFPPVETEISELNGAQINIINNLQSFDWIIFTDVLAVDFFLEILQVNGIDSFELDEIRVCASFEIVSDRLRFAQLHADVIPGTDNANLILEAIRSYVSPEHLSALKFLIVKEKTLYNSLVKTLVESNCEVSEMPIYQIKNAAESELKKLKLLLKNGAADEFVISAPEDLIALKYIFDEEPIETILSEVQVSAANSSILQTLFEHKLKLNGLFSLHKIDKV